jgi:hypothetical protein
MSTTNEVGEATPRQDLIRQLLDPNVPKNEREWCAAREISELLEFVREQVMLWNNDGDSGFPEYEEGMRIVERYRGMPPDYKP